MPEIRLTKAELLSALSHALDMVEGQPPGHATRTALIAQKIAREIGLGEEEQSSLFFASLLKDAGCSNNSARIHKMFGGDEFISKREVKLIDWASPVESIKFALRHTERGGTVASKLRRMLSNVGSPQQVMDEVTQARCTRGAEIALMLGFDQATSDAIRDLDEHWDGRGSPRHKKGQETGVLARILCLSQTLEVFVTALGRSAAYDMLTSRRGSWFDPDLVQAAFAFAGDEAFWEDHAIRAEDATLHLPLPATASIAEDADIDQVCYAFALIIDAKSSFTAEHSFRVTQYATELGSSFGFDPARLQTLRWAALLHDIGKLGVSNSILDKPGRPTDEEFAAIRRHPLFSFEILSRVRGFERVAEIAAAHHERLDGRGYYRGLSGTQLDTEMRILAVADVYDALSADRPYRAAMPPEKVFAILDEESVAGLDAEVVGRLREMKLGLSLAA